MWRVVTLVLVTITLAAGCPGTQSPVQWPDVVQCGSDVANDAIGKVTELLYPQPGEQRPLGRRTRDGLADLARVHTPGVVSCLVRRLAQRWAGARDAGAAMPLEREIALQRAEAWLAETSP